MSAFDDKVLSLMRSTPVPATVVAVAEAMGAKAPLVYSAISRLLNAGELTEDDLPWRANKVQKKRRKRKDTLGMIAEQLKAIAEEGDKDRVAALRSLIELETMGAATEAAPAPNDRPGILAAVCRVLRAAGRDVSAEAFAMTFDDAPDPSTTANGIMITQEAPLEAPNAENMEGDTTSGSSLD